MLLLLWLRRFSGAVLLEPSSKRRRLLPGEKKRPEGFDWILCPQNSGSENRSERLRTNRVARDRGSKAQFCAPNPLSMAAMSAACAACCGTRLITHGHVFLGRRKPRFKVCISKNIPHPFQNFGWVCFSEKHTYLSNRQSMFSGVCIRKNANRWSRIKTRLQIHTPENIPLKTKGTFFNVVGARPKSSRIHSFIHSW